MVNMSVFVTINPCASVSVGGLLRGGVSLGGSLAVVRSQTARLLSNDPNDPDRSTRCW